MLILVGFGCQRTQKFETKPVEINREQILSDARKSGLIMDKKEIERMMDSATQKTIEGRNPSDVSAYLKVDTTKWKSAALADVTGGGSFGLAFSNWQNEKTIVIAKMGNLPALKDGSFYDGWLVHRGTDMSVVNIGKAVVNGDQLVLVFETETDLSDHDFFVLTQDSQHILEGSFR
jgi:hypothetical protein